MIIALLILLMAVGYLYLGLSIYFLIYVLVLGACSILIYIKSKSFFLEMRSFTLHQEIFNGIFLKSNKHSHKLEKYLLKQGLSLDVMKDNNQYDDLMHLMRNKYDLLYWSLLKKQNGNTKYMLDYLNNYYSNKYQNIKTSLNECQMCSIVLSMIFLMFHFLLEIKANSVLLFIVLVLFVLVILSSIVLTIKDEILVDKNILTSETLISLYILSYNVGLKEAIEELGISENQINDSRYYKLIGFLDDIKRNNTMVGNLILDLTINEIHGKKKFDISYTFYLSISMILILLVFGG